METFSLCGLWQMCREGGAKVYPVQIPGSVLGGLLAHGEIEDPCYRTNEYKMMDVLSQDYIFSYDFEYPEEWNSKEYMHEAIVCDGLDTIADIYLNGQYIGHADNMHRTWRFECGSYLCSTNHLEVRITSAMRWIESHPQTPGKEIDYAAEGSMQHTSYIRKAHAMFGWDWGPKLPDMGIWRDIRLEAWDDLRIEQVRFSQEHHQESGETAAVTLTAAVVLEQTAADGTAEVIVEDDSGASIGTALCAIRKGQCPPAVFDIKQPKLWWPNGLGEQPLYRVTVRLCSRTNSLIEEKMYRIGLRTITVSTQTDAAGSEFALTVNGVKMFAMGADYIPEDCIYSRITPERIEQLIQTAVKSNFNCLRVWGGGYYPSDEFYDLCDKYGLIVWQDLMFACNIYDMTQDFEENITAEVTDNVRRLRHHASLGLWCGNNEMEMGWLIWEDVRRHSRRLKADYIKQFEYVLPKILQREDQEHFYWPSSPSSGGSFDAPNDEHRGDAHYWDVWHGQKPFSDYRKYKFRFCSEFGFQSFPSFKTVKTFTEQEDRNIFSEVMESHQKNGAANGKILYYLSENFKYPKDFQSLLYVSQVLQGLAIKYGVEHWRRHRGECMGALYWQFNDNWPVASWSGVDYFGRWKALQYISKKFFAPKLGTIYVEDGIVYVHAVNDSRDFCKVSAVLRLKNMQLEVLEECRFDAGLAALTAVKLGEKDWSGRISGIEKDVFAEAEFIFDDGTKIYQTEVFVPYKYLNLRKPNIGYDIYELQDSFAIELSTDTWLPFVYLDLEERDVLFSDNYFCMGTQKGMVIHAQKTDMCTGETIDITTFRHQLKIRSICDTI